ncbi:M14 family metallopeptidase, partial [Gemmatimonadota bacterium]
MNVFPRGLIPALFLFVFFAGDHSHAGSLRWHLVSVTPAERATENILHNLGFEHIDHKAAAFEVVATPAQLELIRSAGLDAKVVIDNYGAYLAQRNAQAARLAAAGDFAVGSMGGYFSPGEVLSFVDSLRSSLAEQLISDTTVIGLSIQQRPVWMVELGGRSSEDAPEVLFNSLMHSREGLSVMSLLYFMRFLAVIYTAVDSVHWLLDNRRLFFVPVVNPDGYEINWRQYADENQFGLWRKNARDNDGDGAHDGPDDGVDLNRNFGYKWGFDNIGSKGGINYWSWDDFRGDSAFSEPESRVLREFISGRNFRVAINCHTYGNSLLKPWSYVAAETPDSATFDRLGALLVAGSGYVHGNATSVLNYPANGEFTDWEYGDSADGGIIAWTAEIGPSNSNQTIGFWPPVDQIEPIAQKALSIL